MMSLDRCTKLFVLAWAVAAAAFQVWLLRSWDFVWTAPAAFFVTFALGLVTRRAAVAVLAFAYLFPTIIRLEGSGFETEFAISWMAALLGVILADGIRTPWQIARRWRTPLMLWALSITIGTTIVVWREIDYTPALLLDGTISNSSIGGSPAFTVAWVIHVALTQLLGILWFDWLFGRTAVEFDRTVVTPLVLSVLLLVAASIYQMLVDVSFLNPTVFAAFHRAAGTMLDANVAGAVAALWLGGLVVWCERFGTWKWAAAAAAAAIMWLGIWGSGSRTALAAAIIISVSMLVALLKRTRRAQRRGRLIAMAALTAGAIVAVAVFSRADLTVSGPLRRVSEMRTTSVTRLAGDLWRRDGYGTVANLMIRNSPWFGYGPGTFHLLVADFMPGLVPDNAQNWYRHQLAEYGIVGSVGWIAWVLGFAWFMMTRRHTPASASTIGGALLAVGLISLLGVPAQDISVTLTFWTFAFWYVVLVRGEREPAVAPSIAAASRVASANEFGSHAGFPAWRGWAVVGVLLVSYAAGTVYLARTRLRVPMRAQHIGWPYSHGFYPSEKDGSSGEYRWTGQRASAVVDAPRRWLALTVSVNHQDIESKPVEAKVWLDNRLVIDKRLSTTVPVTRYVHLRDDESRVVIDTWASRVIRPSDLGQTDSRELGVMVSWAFATQPPPTADRASLQ
jgi:O-antigen ligase